MDQAGATIIGQEHWTQKGDVKLFRWEKRRACLLLADALLALFRRYQVSWINA